MKKRARMIALCLIVIAFGCALVFSQVGADKKPTPTKTSTPKKHTTTTSKSNSRATSNTSSQPASRNASGTTTNTNTRGTTARSQTQIELVAVPAGTFMMGAENQYDFEKPVHRVTIREGFYLGRYEVTQAQWRGAMGTNPSGFPGCDQCPVEQVTWDEIQEFLRRMNAQGGGYIYRLPSEAEWEYACRAGTTTAFAFGNSLTTAQANFNGSAAGASRVNRQKTMPVGSFQPNAFGLYDMHGNVWEWCEDVWHDNYQGAPTDGTAWTSGGAQQYRVLRGGSWYGEVGDTRSSNRSRRAPGLRSSAIGFRLAASVRSQ